ncbi:VCBS repeat-containing protein [Candidatus Acetothermia bacterium]|nr:VCBS repeat-containing protein [Candidatus Acetothermia bacterium]
MKVFQWVSKIGLLIILLSVLSACSRVVYIPVPTPVAVIKADPTRGYSILKVQFDGSGSYDTQQAPLVSYRWDFGDGSSGSGAKTAHSYEQNREFTATLTVVDQQGYTGSASVVVSVLPPEPSPTSPPNNLQFASAQTIYFQAEWNPSDLALGDVNEDGFVDVILTQPTMGSADSLFVLFGNGHGQFGEKVLGPGPNLTEVRAQRTLEVGDGPVSLALGDLDEDGHLDIVVANSISKDLTIFFGDGKGDFPKRETISLGYRFPAIVRLADFNQDKHLDIVIGNSFPTKLTVILGDGQGEFEDPQDIDIGRWPITALEIADLNHDEIPDLAVLDKSGGLTLLSGDGTGDFHLLGTQQTQAIESRGSLGFGDFNKDSDLDIALPVEASNSFALRLFLLGAGGAGLDKPRDATIDRNPVGLQVADVDADGNLDVVVAVSGAGAASIAFLRGDGAGNFYEPSFFSLGPGQLVPRKLILADVDGDGDLDAITLNTLASFPLHASGSLSILLNTTK